MRPTYNARKRFIAAIISLSFIFSVVNPPLSYSQPVQLPVPGTMLPLTKAYTPVTVKGLIVNPAEPFKFDFVLDTGTEKTQGAALKEESMKLIKYFLASLTVPEKDMWVNLSPYEKDKMVEKTFGATEMGRDLLAQDYILKQMTASLTYPEKELGKKFWDEVYSKVQAQYGNVTIPVDTFNKVWIVPSKAQVYEHQNGAFVTESRLKVMLEEDYLSLKKNSPVKNSAHRASQQIASEAIRTIVLPALEEEVNTGKNFATLRQIYQAMILATWYKVRLSDSILGQLYVDKQKTNGVASADKFDNQKIYESYLQAFKKGAYNYIKEEKSGPNSQTVAKKYVSGGAGFIGTRDLLDRSAFAQTPKFVGGAVEVSWAAQDSAQLVSDIERFKESLSKMSEVPEVLKQKMGTLAGANFVKRALSQVNFNLSELGIIQSTLEKLVKEERAVHLDLDLAKYYGSIRNLLAAVGEEIKSRLEASAPDYIPGKRALPDGAMLGRNNPINLANESARRIDANTELVKAKGPKVDDFITEMNKLNGESARNLIRAFLYEAEGLRFLKRVEGALNQDDLTVRPGKIGVTKEELMLIPVVSEIRRFEAVSLARAYLKDVLLTAGYDIKNISDEDILEKSTKERVLRVLEGVERENVLRNTRILRLGLDLKKSGELYREQRRLLRRFSESSSNPQDRAEIRQLQYLNDAINEINQRITEESEALGIDRAMVNSAAESIFKHMLAEVHHNGVLMSIIDQTMKRPDGNEVLTAVLHQSMVDVADPVLKENYARVWGFVDAAYKNVENSSTYQALLQTVLPQLVGQVASELKDDAGGRISKIDADKKAQNVLLKVANKLGVILVFNGNEGVFDEVDGTLLPNTVVIPEALKFAENDIQDAVEFGELIYRGSDGTVHPIIYNIADVIEGTSAFYANDKTGSGASSILSGGLIPRLISAFIDGYALQLFTNLGDRDKAIKFENKKEVVLRKDKQTNQYLPKEFSLSDPELYAENPEKIAELLSFFSKEFDIMPNDLSIEFVVMKRSTEERLIEELNNLKATVYPKLVVTLITAGTVAHGLDALLSGEQFNSTFGFTRKTQFKVMLTRGGSAEAFDVLVRAALLEANGAVGGVRIAAKDMAKPDGKTELKDQSGRYKFSNVGKEGEKSETAQIEELRAATNDAKAILEGRKFFSSSDFSDFARNNTFSVFASLVPGYLGISQGNIILIGNGQIDVIRRASDDFGQAEDAEENASRELNAKRINRNLEARDDAAMFTEITYADVPELKRQIEDLQSALKEVPENAAVRRNQALMRQQYEEKVAQLITFFHEEQIKFTQQKAEAIKGQLSPLSEAMSVYGIMRSDFRIAADDTGLPLGPVEYKGEVRQLARKAAIFPAVSSLSSTDSFFGITTGREGLTVVQATFIVKEQGLDKKKLINSLKNELASKSFLFVANEEANASFQIEEGKFFVNEKEFKVIELVDAETKTVVGTQITMILLLQSNLIKKLPYDEQLNALTEVIGSLAGLEQQLPPIWEGLRVIGINGAGGNTGALVLESALRSFSPQSVKLILNVRSDTVDTIADNIRYNEVHGEFPGVVTVISHEGEGNRSGVIEVGVYQNPDKPQDGFKWAHRIYVMSSGKKEVGEIAWADQNGGQKLDYIIDATGLMKDGKDAKAHLDNPKGANHVVITAPATNVDQVIVYGVNDAKIDPKSKTTSCASCTTNAVAPTLESALNLFLLKKNARFLGASGITFHAITNSQKWQIPENLYKKLEVRYKDLLQILIDKKLLERKESKDKKTGVVTGIVYEIKEKDIKKYEQKYRDALKASDKTLVEALFSALLDFHPENILSVQETGAGKAVAPLLKGMYEGDFEKKMAFVAVRGGSPDGSFGVVAVHLHVDGLDSSNPQELAKLRQEFIDFLRQESLRKPDVLKVVNNVMSSSQIIGDPNTSLVIEESIKVVPINGNGDFTIEFNAPYSNETAYARKVMRTILGIEQAAAQEREKEMIQQQTKIPALDPSVLKEKLTEILQGLNQPTYATLDGQMALVLYRQPGRVSSGLIQAIQQLLTKGQIEVYEVRKYKEVENRADKSVSDQIAIIAKSGSGKDVLRDTELVDKLKEAIRKVIDEASTAIDNAKSFTRGGIDLDRASMSFEIKRDEKGMPLPFKFQNLQKVKIDGLYPVILNISPVKNLPVLLGLDPKSLPRTPIALEYNSLTDPIDRRSAMSTQV